jgi:hypothetical protein
MARNWCWFVHQDSDRGVEMNTFDTVDIILLIATAVGFVAMLIVAYAF